MRIGHDIDPVTFMHWKPSTDESDYPQEIRRYRADQNKILAQRWLSPHICSAGLRAKLLATHKHGANKIEVKAHEDDGLAIYWVICQLFHPINREYRRTLEADLCKMHLQFRSGNPHPALDLLQCKVREAMDVAARIKWDVVAIPLINTLELRDSKFTHALEDWRDRPLDPDDSIVDLDQLVSIIKEVVVQCDDGRKDWEEKSARVSQKDDLSEMKRRLQALEAQTHKGKPTPPKALAMATGTCMMPKCGRVIKPWKAGWKLCSTCLLKVVEGGKAVTLTDGTPWTPHHAKCCMGEMRALGAIKKGKSKGGKSALKRSAEKARKAAKRAALSDPESPGGQDGDADECDAYERRITFSQPTEDLYKQIKGGSSNKKPKRK